MAMGLSLTHIIITLLVILIVFGAGKLPQVMSDLGKGLKNFKDAMNNDDQSKEKSNSKKLGKNK